MAPRRTDVPYKIRWLRGGRSLGSHAPRLWPVWIAAPLVVLSSAMLAWFIHRWLRPLAPIIELTTPDGGHQLGINSLELMKVTLTSCAFIGAVLAGLYAYRKQRLSEGDAQRADSEQFAVRYRTTAEQLGHDKAAVRLAGAYAMGRLADDWTAQRQICIDVLCAYLRMPYETDSTSENYRIGEREVRHTIIGIIRDHIAGSSTDSWTGNNFDLSGAVFDGGSFAGADFSTGVFDFREAKFIGGLVDFSRANFSTDVRFTKAEFVDGIVTFESAEFNDESVNFDRAIFDGATVDFRDAMINNIGMVFTKGHFRSGVVSFSHVKFSAGTVDFKDATFSGANVDFRSAKFQGSRVNFNSTQIVASNIFFGNAHIVRGELSFDMAELNGRNIDFGTAIYDAPVTSFDAAHFTGTNVTWGPIPVPIENST
jgi:uncharacterized protein YjbI with pentapeptide repeats